MLAQRHSWIWMALAPGSRRIWCVGEDDELAELLRQIGFEVVEHQLPGPAAADGAPPDAIVIAADPHSALTAASRAARALAPDGVVAVPVAGGSRTAPRPVSRASRALELAGSPLTALGADLAGRRVAREMRRSGFHVSRISTGDRVRVRYGIGSGGWVKRRRLPVGSIVTGRTTAGVPSVVDAATQNAARALGRPLAQRAANVFESGKLAVELVDPDGVAYYLSIAAPQTSAGLQRSSAALRAILDCDPPGPIRDRIMSPIAEGRVGQARYVLEPHAPGRHPVWMTSRAWDDCLEFLTALHQLPRRASPPPALGGPWPNLESGAEFLGRNVAADERRVVERVHAEISDRLSGAPLGGGHGDFWSRNLILRRGRLRAVVDWEWAAKETLPLLDLMDLRAQLGLRRSRGLPPGSNFIEVLWPLAQEGGDEHMRILCAATGTTGDPRILEGLAMAHWLLRTARGGSIRPHRLQDPSWFGDNILAPLALLKGALEPRALWGANRRPPRGGAPARGAGAPARMASGRAPGEPRRGT